MRLYPMVPHPFLLAVAPDNRMAAAASVTVDDPLNGGTTRSLELVLTLIGKPATLRSPALVDALRIGALAGVGRGDFPAKLDKVEQEDTPGSNEWREVWTSPGSGWRLQAPKVICEEGLVGGPLSLWFPVPLRLKGDRGLVKPGSFKFADFLSRLARRVSTLAFFHGNGEVKGDYRDLMERARQVQPENIDLRWYDWQRRSNRQKKMVAMGGLVGRVTLQAEDATAFWPLLNLGQFVHVGAGTAMGLGRYLVSFSPADSRANGFSAAEGGQG